MLRGLHIVKPCLQVKSQDYGAKGGDSGAVRVWHTVPLCLHVLAMHACPCAYNASLACTCVLCCPSNLPRQGYDVEGGGSTAGRVYMPVLMGMRMRARSSVCMQVCALLSIQPPSPEAKIAMLKEVAAEQGVDWDPAKMQEDLLQRHEDSLVSDEDPYSERRYHRVKGIISE